MNKDVYTTAPANTYALVSLFTVPNQGSLVKALSFSKDQTPLVLAFYTIIVQFLFAAIWQLFVAGFLLVSSLNDRMKLVGMVAFWNCSDPFSATLKGLEYLLNTLSYQQRSWRHTAQASLMALTAALTVALSLWVGILYPEWLSLGEFAPVHPSSVFWPYFGDALSNAAIIEIYSLTRPGILRSLGSAEAGELNSKEKAVTIKPGGGPRSSTETPHEAFDYSYSISSLDFGLQVLPDLAMQVRGGCRTDYSWSQRKTRTDGGLKQVDDVYYPWHNMTSDQWDAVATEESIRPLPRLSFVTWVRDPGMDTLQHQHNRSFAFLPTAALVPSHSHSDDPWYQTTNAPRNKEFTLDLPYHVKSNRPVLECWETTEICMQGSCFTPSNLQSSPLPTGLEEVFRTRFFSPMMARIGLSAGVGCLKGYFGSAGGIYIDASKSTLLADMSRLVLAAYLSSRQVFQEIALTPRPTQDSRNSLEGSVGRLLDGAAAFVVSTGDAAVALRFDLILAAPVLCAILWLLIGLLEVVKRRGTWLALSIRGAALSAAQLYRQLDELRTGERWLKPRAGVPRPLALAATEWDVSVGNGADDRDDEGVTVQNPRVIFGRKEGAGGADTTSQASTELMPISSRSPA